jgi:hypothetical protein
MPAAAGEELLACCCTSTPVTAPQWTKGASCQCCTFTCNTRQNHAAMLSVTFSLSNRNCPHIITSFYSNDNAIYIAPEQEREQRLPRFSNYALIDYKNLT